MPMLCARVTKEQAERLPPLSHVVAYFEREVKLNPALVAECAIHGKPLITELGAKCPKGWVCRAALACIGRRRKPAPRPCCVSCGGVLETEESIKRGVCSVCAKTILTRLSA